MFSIDLNCDLGEGTGNDPDIMPFISSANIACGYHAGDHECMEETIQLCKKYKVAAGAHPSFRDRQNFGRTEMNLNEAEIYELMIKQLNDISAIASAGGIRLHHVKPHGALYNMSAKNISLAQVIAKAVKDFDKDLILYGLSGSHSIHEAKALGLKTASEVFADRSYQDDGSLTPRSNPSALIEDGNKAVQQALHLIRDGMVKTISGKEILLVADTICLHGDGKNAVKLARTLHKALQGEDIIITKI